MAKANSHNGNEFWSRNISKLEKEHLGKADFIICVVEDMTTTY